MTEGRAVLNLIGQKLSLLRDVLDVTQESLLLVDLEGLTPLLERKDGLIREISLVDEAIGLHERMPPEAELLREELAEVVQAVLENERTLEARIEEEQAQLRRELMEFDQETRLRQYLERGRSKGRRLNLKK